MAALFNAGLGAFAALRGDATSAQHAIVLCVEQSTLAVRSAAVMNENFAYNFEIAHGMQGGQYKYNGAFVINQCADI